MRKPQGLFLKLTFTFMMKTLNKLGEEGNFLNLMSLSTGQGESLGGGWDYLTCYKEISRRSWREVNVGRLQRDHGAQGSSLAQLMVGKG